MNRVSVALASGFTSPLSLLSLSGSGPIGFGLSAGMTLTDTFVLWGTLDAAATDATNAQHLGQFAGPQSTPLPAEIAAVARYWPYLLVERTGGTTVGTFYASGDAGSSPAVVSVSAPAVGTLSGVLDVTAFAAGSVRVGGSRQMTVEDVFDVYAAQVSVVSTPTDCFYVGRITGGGGTGIISLLVSGYPYVFVQRVAGTTTGSILAAGNAVPQVFGNNVVGTLASLPTTAAEGVLYYVSSRYSFYLRSGGSWVRTRQTNPSWATREDIYVSYATGSNDNEGTLLAPLASVPEVLARLGDNPINSTGFFWVHVLDGPTEVDWKITAPALGTQSITISGEPSVALTTTVTVVPWNTAPNTPGTMTGAASLAAYAASSTTTDGRIWRIRGGVRDGVYGSFRLDTGGGAVEYQFGALLWIPGGVQPQTGDTIEVLTNITGPNTVTVGPDTTLFLSGFDFVSGLHAVNVQAGGACWISGCRFFGGMDAGPGGLVSVVASTGASGTVRASGPGSYAEVFSTRVGNLACRSLNSMQLGDITLEQRLTINSSSIVIHASGLVQLENSAAGTTLDIEPGSTWEHATVAGNLQGRNVAGGATGVIHVYSGARFVGPSPTVAATGNEFNVGGTARLFTDVTAGYQNPNNFAAISLRT